MKRRGNSWKVQGDDGSAWKRAVTVLLTVALFGSMTTSAFGAARFCGTGVKRTVTTVTAYVGAAWDRPGYRQMSTRRLWSDTPTYYVCRPVTR